MFLVEESIVLLTYIGMWKSDNWTETQRFWHNIWSTVILAINFSFLLSEFLDLVLLSESIANFIDGLLLMLTWFYIFVKMFNLLYNRRRIEDLFRSLSTPPFAPIDKNEEDIRNNVARPIRLPIKSYFIMSLTLLVFFIPFELFGDRKPGVLPFRGWMPYNYSEPTIYWLTACYQMFMPFSGCLVNTSWNVIFVAMLLHLTIQAHTLRHRCEKAVEILKDATQSNMAASQLRKLERNMFGPCVDYHIEIVSLAERFNAIFTNAVYIQHLTSSTILCACAYTMAKADLFSTEWLTRFGFLLSIWSQTALLSLISSHTTTQFSDIKQLLYSTDWFVLNSSGKKCMEMVVMMADRPFVFHCNHIMQLDVESFKGVMTLAYSIYNIL